MSATNFISNEWGGEEGHSEAMKVHVCKAKNPSNEARQKAKDGVKNGLNQLLSYGAIEGWKTTQWNMDLELTCDGGLLKEWSSFRDSNGLDADGCWLLVHKCGTSVADNSGDAWGSDLDAVVKTDWLGACSSDDPFKAIAIQEVFHAFIDSSDCPNVQYYIDNGEHDLGNEQQGTNGDFRTPMCVAYETAPDGECDNSIWGLTDCAGSTELNKCEKAAVRESREHYFGRHS